MEPSKTFLPLGPCTRLVEKRFLVQAARSIAFSGWVYHTEGRDFKPLITQGSEFGLAVASHSYRLGKIPG
jgi:hypothetical protein